MIERTLILLGIIAFGLVIWLGWRRFLDRKLANLSTQAAPPELTHLLPEGPALLYFTGPHCAQCRLQQTPILAQFSAATTIKVHTIDATEQENLAQFYGVMTVPTTVLLDPKRTPKAINHGLISLTQLQQQVALFLA